MADITVKVKGTKQMRRQVARAGKRAMLGVASALNQEAEAVMSKSKREVPVDEGTLRASGFVRPPKVSKSNAEISFGYGGAAKGYAVFLHEGTGPAVGRPPFMPPVDAIEEWAQRVIGEEGLGFVIARSIGKKGLEPRKFLERPLRKSKRGMDKRIGKRVERFMERA